MFRAVHEAPFAVPPECDAGAVEWLDASGRSLLVTSRPQRTGLVRAMVGLLCRAPGRRIHARRLETEAPGGSPSPFAPGWTLAAVGPVLAAEAREDAVWRLLLAETYWQTQLAPFVLPELMPLKILEPDETDVFFPAAQFGLARLHLYQLRVLVTPPATDDHLWLDPQEAAGLAEQFRGVFSPLLTLALASLKK